MNTRNDSPRSVVYQEDRLSQFYRWLSLVIEKRARRMKYGKGRVCLRFRLEAASNRLVSMAIFRAMRQFERRVLRDA